MDAARPVTALFSTQFLEYSQTFVYEEIRLHQRYDIEVFTRRRLNEDRFPYEPVHVAGRGYQATRLSRRFEKLFKRRDYALVHAHFGIGGVYGLRYAQKFNKPFVVTFHGYDVPLLTSPQRLLPQYWRYGLYGPKVLEGMTLGLCASRELMEMLHSLGVPMRKLRLYRLGVDLERFTPPAERPEGGPRVLMIGRFVEKKGFLYGMRGFAEACQRLPADSPKPTLTLIGGGDGEADLRACAAQHGISSQVEFTGPISSDEVAARLAAADVLIAPSVVARDGNRESGLIVVKEASACGVVPIGTWHGGIHEIIEDKVTGHLVPERNPPAIAEALLGLLTNPERRAEMGRAARARMERLYDAQRRILALEEHYDEARALFRG